MEEIQDMTKEQYESLSAVQLKEIAKSRGLKNLSGLKKGEVIARMLEADEAEQKKNRGLIFHSLTVGRQ